MAETYIRSLYEDIYVDDESVGNGYYTYSGSWVSDANYYTTKKKNRLFNRWLFTHSKCSEYHCFMTYWDRLGNFISTQRLDVANGKYFLQICPQMQMMCLSHSTNRNLKLRLIRLVKLMR